MDLCTVIISARYVLSCSESYHTIRMTLFFVRTMTPTVHTFIHNPYCTETRPSRIASKKIRAQCWV